MKLVSVIIPVHNGGAAFDACLQALQQTIYPDWECIVVNDGSTDDSVAIAQRYNAHIISCTPARSGPAHARNVGAQAARGDLLFFIDADVQVQPGTMGHAAAILECDPELAACFGSYDESPSQTNFLSQYRNLLHHYTHQVSDANASTFWSGCGMIRRHVFEKVGGFETLTPGRPSIEDIALGYRLRHAGYSIRLEKLLQVKHLKRWSLWGMLVTDIRDRAWPWTKLIVNAGALPNDLNLQVSQRLSSVLALAGLLTLLLMVWQPLFGVITAVIAIILLQLNRRFYRFLRQKRGFVFSLRAMFSHWLYFIYSGITFGLGIIRFSIQRWQAPPAFTPKASAE